ncbi:MAG: NAD(P)/FAD-dependent oxidoreductase [Rhodospirillales bacterium]
MRGSPIIPDVPTGIGGPLRIAVIGSGAAGLAAAWALSQRHEVVLYEAAERLGGHANTVNLPGPDGPVAVDTGFIVYNEPNYPNLVRLLAHLGVASIPSTMSFAVSMDRGAYEYSGSAGGLFAQPRNLVSPSHWRLVGDALRFFRLGRGLLASGGARGSLGDFLEAEGFSQSFRSNHLLPMAAAIWSAPPDEILSFPLATFLRFFDNHGLLQTGGRPQWRSVAGGSRSYVAAIAASLGPTRLRLSTPVAAVETHGLGVSVIDAQGHRDRFDQVVLACHADSARTLLAEGATARERQVLSAFRYSDNQAFLHGDTALMPRRRRVWSSWNYLAGQQDDRQALCVTYWMNRLQSLDPRVPLFVTLNPGRAPRSAKVYGAYSYQHPIFDQAALDAQQSLPEIQGRRGLWFCGSYCGYGFHEDAIQAGVAVAAALDSPVPWTDQVIARSPAVECALTVAALAAE